MKKILIYIIAIVAISFTMSIMLTKETKTNEVSTEVEQKVENSFIKLLHKETNNVEELGLETYLYGVVSAEMPASYEMEALKAQAVVARTYTKFKQKEKKHENADICDDSTCCQAWISKENRFARWEEAERESNWQKIVSAVDSTAGKYVVYEGEPINAFFHSNSGGTTELPVNVWGGSGLPYLQVVETAGEEGYSQYASEVELTKDELITKLKEKYEDIQIDFGTTTNEDIKILEYTDGNRVKTVKFGNHEISGVEARSIFGLKSTNFEITKEADKIKFVVKGYGHGVGMSQTGADTMAKQGSNYEEIINHFYIGVEIKEINSL